MNNRLRDFTQIAIFPALMGATASISIPLFDLPPITLQTMFVFLAALVLGPKKAGISMAIYVILGVIGLPIFSGHTSGVGIILGKSGGFLIGFIISAFAIGFMKNVNFINKGILTNSFILFIGNLIIYVCGATYIAFLINGNILLILASFAPYLIGDILKIYASLLIYKRVSAVLIYEYA